MKIKFFIIILHLNGQKYKIFMIKPITLLDIITFFDYQKQLSLIEYNGKIQSDIETHCLYIKKDAKIEIITIVGGG